MPSPRAVADRRAAFRAKHPDLTRIWRQDADAAVLVRVKTAQRRAGLHNKTAQVLAAMLAVLEETPA